MIRIYYSKNTKTWRTHPENYMLLGIMHTNGKPGLYTDHAIDRALLDSMKKDMPKLIYKIVRVVLDRRKQPATL